MNDILYKFKPFLFEKIQYRAKNSVPKARSGHRIVSTNSELYSFGGYNPKISDSDPELGTDEEWQSTRPLFRELWRYSFVSGKWTRLPTSHITPLELASHCTQLIEDKYMLIYGGTGYPFSDKPSNKLFVLNLITNEWKPIEYKNTNQSQIPTEQYGQALVTDDSGDLYVVGGTTGYVYTLDVHKFDTKRQLWHKLYTKPFTSIISFPEERYRHEMVFYDNKLFVFGGGTASMVFTLSMIPVFDLQNNQWINTQTKSDINSLTPQSSGYPSDRKCHACVRIDDNVFIIGGTDGIHIFDDLWKFELSSLQWTLLSVRIPRPLYFHSASVSPSGRLSVFGGVITADHNERTNELFTVWVKIPSLKIIALEAILFYNRSINEMFSNFDLNSNTE